MGRKNPKGSVSIDNDKTRIRLRWRYLKKRYSLNLFLFTKANLLKAKKIAVSIESDIVNETFDFSLQKYRYEDAIARKEAISFVKQFEEWVKKYKNMDCEKHVDYHAVRNMIKRWGNFSLDIVITKLGTEKFNERTYNKRLRMLNVFFAWLEKSKVIQKNPLEDVQPKKVKRKPSSSRKPFTEDEIRKILHAFKLDTFCRSNSRFKHSHYYPFLYFIFKTGVRNAEAIGLRVKHVQVGKGLIEISEVLARSLKGTNASARIRKETKNGKERFIPLSKDLLTILKPLLKNKKVDDLVFLSPKGIAIDDRMFQRRNFKPVLKSLGIEERVLYACRHTFGSRCIAGGISPVMTAFLMGNNPETALRNYTHLITLPESLPMIE